MSWLKSLKSKGKARAGAEDPMGLPPAWEPAPEESHEYGLHIDASGDDFESAELFCQQNPLEPPKLLSSELVERIDATGCSAWHIERPVIPRFRGKVHASGEKGTTLGIERIETYKGCGFVCLFSTLPILAGLYDIQGKSGVYYETTIRRMDGTIAVGTACKPYPEWRFPGWNRLSAGLHLDDFRKFFEDPCGGRDYSPLLTRISPGDIIGCGYAFATASVFFTHNGLRLPDAFVGLYLPRIKHDVYAAIGVEGENELEVNFGGDVFKWKEGNEWAWRVEGHVGRMAGGLSGADDELPSYAEARGFV